MQAIFSNKVLIGIVLTFIIGGLGAISGMVSESTAGWVTLIIALLTGIGHTTNIVKGISH